MFQTLFGDPNKRKIKKYEVIVDEINKLEPTLQSLTDSQLQSKTAKLIDSVHSEKDLDIILPDAFALVREASYRVLGLRHFDVQLLGGIILHEGKIAEMKTGEGKTLVAILAAYLNALSKKGVHVVTVNDYLAKRDAEWVGQVPKFLGLSIGLVQQGISQQERENNYSKDITYITNSELGFDYLRDNMAIEMNDMVQRDFYFCIIDEVDSILIDEARTPLIISGAGDAVDEKYIRANEISKYLDKTTHYEVDEKARNIILTEEGILKCEELLDNKGLYNPEDPWASYIFNAVKAKELFTKDVHYIVKENEVIIVDEFTGRIMVGRRWSDGLHQAIEAKEGATIQNESQTLASITYQNFFLLYPKLSGMTGTAKTEAYELDKIYGLDVICVPTNKKMKRKDFPDLVYKSQYSKWKSIADECLDMHTLGRPVLVGTTSVEKSELLSSLLLEYGIPHNLLNAKPENIKREAEIIAQAGRKGSVTIATNMAGRGTDILLGGNSSYMAKAALSQLTGESTSAKVLIKDDPKLETLSKFLRDQIKLLNLSEEAIQEKISIACEKGFTDDPFIITLRASYQVLEDQYSVLIKKEREEVLTLGGLHVIGTERHESRRVDNQLRGRAGRQGDPGSSRFFLSLEDNLFRIFGGDRIASMMDTLRIEESVPIESSFLNKSLESAQKKVEAYYYDARKQLFEYDEVLNYQRQAIYSERRRILASRNLRNWILQYAETTIRDYVTQYFNTIEQDKSSEPSQRKKLLQKVEDLLGLPYTLDMSSISNLSAKEMTTFLCQHMRIAYDLKESQIELIENGLMRDLERSFLLQKIDSAWKEHLQNMNGLRETIGWRGYGQKDPLIEYKNEAYSLFTSMSVNVRHSVIYLIFRAQPILKN
uniref:Protein translocase subunit SecA n=1 Tax=Chroomonas placoidea TaxID=173977 RepID=A0A222AI38_9CRYP|nr:preprotein translocase subunit SecA [Chroomonas placoidea]ASO76033.1 preprotein translocase subunit SecA [Chroomonas placoidea]